MHSFVAPEIVCKTPVNRQQLYQNDSSLNQVQKRIIRLI